MKRILLALTIAVLALPAIPRAQAADVSVDFFYNNLSGGSWIEVADYGYCWQPDVASSVDWRPYADGYWAYTDLGWTWVSYEDFGWATYHYGRWVRLSGRGWVWVPGRDEDLEWGPAWVSWRTGGDYIGWAPLPPRRRGGIAISFGARIGGRVDIDFDIGPDYYNFVDVRYIGEPVLRDRIYQRTQNVTYINQTVNVTNITYQDNRVYNYGPDYNTLSTRSSRPIQRLKVEQQTNFDAGVAVRSGTLTKVEGDRLVVAAPTTIKKSAKPIAPPTVMEKVATAKVDDGWSGVSDPKQKEEVRKKMQTEDNKKVPPPTAGASAAAQTGASGAGTASPATSASPFGTGRKPGEKLQPTVSASPAASASPASPGKGKNKFEQPGASVAPGASALPSMTPQFGKPTKGKEKLDRAVPSATATAADTSSKSNLNSSKSNIYKSVPSTPGETSTELPKGKGKSQLERGPLVPTPGPESSTELPTGKGKAKQLEPMATPTVGGNESPQGGAGGGGKEKMKGANVQSPIAPIGAGPAGPAGGGEHGKGKAGDVGEKGAKPEKGEKGKKGEESPAPTP